MKTLSGLKVLVVDDYEINLQVLTLSLKKLEMIPTIVNNGLEALDIFKDEKFDLILMDLMMPIMDGFEATRQIRNFESQQNRKPSIIIAVSANQLTEKYESVSQWGFDDILPKPFIISDLRTVISKYFLK